MSLLDVTERFVGKELREALDLWWVTDETNYNWLAAVAFDFGRKFLIFRAESTDDTISVHETDHLDTWIRSQESSQELRRSKNKYCGTFIGRPLVYVWECQNTKGYIDAVDLAFGNLVVPSVKLLCAGSQLYLCSIQKLEVEGAPGLKK